MPYFSVARSSAATLSSVSASSMNPSNMRTLGTTFTAASASVRTLLSRSHMMYDMADPISFRSFGLYFPLISSRHIGTKVCWISFMASSNAMNVLHLIFRGRPPSGAVNVVRAWS